MKYNSDLYSIFDEKERTEISTIAKQIMSRGEGADIKDAEGVSLDDGNPDALVEYLTNRYSMNEKTALKLTEYVLEFKPIRREDRFYELFGTIFYKELW